MHVLIVDDNVDLRMLISKALRNEGISSDSAVDGKDAIEKLKSVKTPSVILLDLMMPVMDGFEFLKWKSTSNDWAGTPVIILSASAHSEIPEGAVAFIKKPVDLNDLFEVLKKHGGNL